MRKFRIIDLDNPWVILDEVYIGRVYTHNDLVSGWGHTLRFWDGSLSHLNDLMAGTEVGVDWIKFELVEEENMFKKEDLKTGMILVLRDHTVGLYLSLKDVEFCDKSCNCWDGMILGIYGSNINQWDENLKYRNTDDNSNDIMFVIKPNNLSSLEELKDIEFQHIDGEILWERIEKSEEEIELEKLEQEARNIADRISELRKNINKR